VRADDTRAQLVIPAFCETGVRCNINDAGVSQQTCVQNYLELWEENQSDAGDGGQSADCLDAQLDLLSCVAVQADCAQLPSCEPFRTTQDAKCEVPDVDGSVPP